LAVEQAKDKEWTASGHPLVIRHADSGSDPLRLRGQVVRLLTVNRVAALLAGPGSQAANEVIRAARPYGGVVVVPGEVPVGPAPDVWPLGVGPARRGQLLARLALDTCKAKRAALLVEPADRLNTELAAAFRKAWPNRAAAREWILTSGQQPADLVARIAETRPEVVLYAGPLEQLHRWREALRTGGLTVPVLLGGEEGSLQALQGDKSPGTLYLATVYTTEGLTERGREFVQRFTDRFGETPDHDAAQSYDGAWLLLEALHNAGGGGTRLREQLATMDFHSVTGPVRWDKGQTRRAVFLLRVQPEGISLVRTVNPDE
jgi:branched-chain amino acid transport system substrate-binding protein